MPRHAKPLTAAKTRTAPPGRYGDGSGLYLFVRSRKAAFWVFRYTPRGGRMREMGLGPARGPDAVSLADVRDKAAPLRRLVRNGVDPLAQRYRALLVTHGLTGVRDRVPEGGVRASALSRSPAGLAGLVRLPRRAG